MSPHKWAELSEVLDTDAPQTADQSRACLVAVFLQPLKKLPGAVKVHISTAKVMQDDWLSFLNATVPPNHGTLAIYSVLPGPVIDRCHMYTRAEKDAVVSHNVPMRPVPPILRELLRFAANLLTRLNADVALSVPLLVNQLELPDDVLEHYGLVAVDNRRSARRDSDRN